MGIDDVCFAKPINSDFYCIICLDLLEDTVHCVNEHYYCRACIVKAIELRPVCPTCSIKLSVATLVKSRLVDRLIADLPREVAVKQEGKVDLPPLRRSTPRMQLATLHPGRARGRPKKDTKRVSNSSSSSEPSSRRGSNGRGRRLLQPKPEPMSSEASTSEEEVEPVARRVSTAKRRRTQQSSRDVAESTPPSRRRSSGGYELRSSIRVPARLGYSDN